MDYDVSGIKTPEEYAAELEPWFLNAVNKLAAGSTNTKVLKIDAFAIIPLEGHKGNKIEEKKYVGFKGSMAYWNDMETVVERLVERRCLERHPHPAYVTITDEGVRRCNDPPGPNSWNVQFYPPSDKPPREMLLR